MTKALQTFCGQIAFIGRPNVGKSTLLNALMGTKISITSRKAQTTQEQIVGFRTYGTHQLVYVDLPGINFGRQHKSASTFNHVAMSALSQVDRIAFMSAGSRWLENDQKILQWFSHQNRMPDFWLINKVDEVHPKSQLLSHIQRITAQYPIPTVYPLTAYDPKAVAELTRLFCAQIPLAPFYSDQPVGTNLPLEKRIVELIREQLYRYLQQEVPYQTHIRLEQIEHQTGNIALIATVLLRTTGQKRILQQMLAQPHARFIEKAEQNISALFGDRPVTLSLWPKVVQS